MLVLGQVAGEGNPDPLVTGTGDVQVPRGLRAEQLGVADRGPQPHRGGVQPLAGRADPPLRAPPGRAQDQVAALGLPSGMRRGGLRRGGLRHVHLDHQVVSVAPGAAQYRRGQLDLHPQLEPGPVRAEPDPGGDLARLGSLGGPGGRTVQPRRAPHAAPADQHEGVPVTRAPAAAGPQPAGVDLAPEPGPVVGVSLLPGQRGRVGVLGGPRRHHDRQPSPAARHQHHDLGGIAAPGDAHRRHEREAGDDQPVPGPLDALDPDERAQLAPVRLVQPVGHVLVGAERQVGPQPPALADHRHGLDRLVGGPHDELQQLVQPVVQDQVVGQPVARRQPAEHPFVDLGQVGPGQPHELGVEPRAGPAQLAHVQPDVVVQRLALVLPDHAGGLVRPQERVDEQQHVDPVGVVADVGAGLGDRQRARAPFPPEVDRVGDDVHRPGQHVGPGDQVQVLPDNALGKDQAVHIPERLAEQLVPHRDVIEQRGCLADMRAGFPGLDGLGVQRRLGDAERADSLHVAGDKVRARILQHVQQARVGMGRQGVVRVHERQVHSPGPLDAAVARVARAAIRHLEQGKPRVGRGLCRRDGRAAVGRPVVDHDDLEVAESLRGDGFQAVPQQVLVVEERDNNADPRNCHS